MLENVWWIEFKPVMGYSAKMFALGMTSSFYSASTGIFIFLHVIFIFQHHLKHLWQWLSQMLILFFSQPFCETYEWFKDVEILSIKQMQDQVKVQNPHRSQISCLSQAQVVMNLNLQHAFDPGLKKKTKN